MHWKACPVHVIDFEGSRESGVVEYGVVTLRDGDITACDTRLCRPTGEISAAEQRQHGISGSDAASGEPFTAEWGRFSGYRQRGPLAAHHAMVEEGFLKQVWPYPPESPVFLEPGRTVASWGPWLDTRQLYAQVYPDLGSFALSELIAAFSLRKALGDLAEKHCPQQRRRYHCALYDAIASALLIIHLGRQPGFEELSIAWLLTHSQSSADKREAARQGGLFG